VPHAERPTDPEFAPTHEVKFADGYPILVALEVRFRMEALEVINLLCGGDGQLAAKCTRANNQKAKCRSVLAW
jgi:hypothetical protein